MHVLSRSIPGDIAHPPAPALMPIFPVPHTELETSDILCYTHRMTENALSENSTVEKYLIFSALEKRYALPSKFISEVAALEKVFPLPLAAEYVRGIINRYSEPYALIDICRLLRKDTAQTGSGPQKMLVLKEETDQIALLVDDILDFAEIEAESLTAIESDDASSGTSDSLAGAFFDWKGNPVFCLEIEELISRIKQGVIQLGA